MALICYGSVVSKSMVGVEDADVNRGAMMVPGLRPRHNYCIGTRVGMYTEAIRTYKVQPPN